MAAAAGSSRRASGVGDSWSDGAAGLAGDAAGVGGGGRRRDAGVEGSRPPGSVLLRQLLQLNLRTRHLKPMGRDAAIGLVAQARKRPAQNGFWQGYIYI